MVNQNVVAQHWPRIDSYLCASQSLSIVDYEKEGKYLAEIDAINHYYKTVRQQGLYPSPGNLRFYLKYLFEDTSFTGKNMLDIGGGDGVFSFYAGSAGASHVVCLEPVVAGSSPGMKTNFQGLSTALDLDQVILHPIRFQDYDPGSEKFDIILLHNSINHLDEDACINLQNDSEAVASYSAIFDKLSTVANPGAKLIITDCSRYNFFALTRLKNPFPYGETVEWHKHQSPTYWVRLLSNTGFNNPKIRWTSFNTLRFMGRLLLGNRIAAYFIQSLFCLTMEK